MSIHVAGLYRDGVQVVLDLRQHHLGVPLAQKELQQDLQQQPTRALSAGIARRPPCPSSPARGGARTRHLSGWYSFFGSRIRFHTMFTATRGGGRR